MLAVGNRAGSSIGYVVFFYSPVAHGRAAGFFLMGKLGLIGFVLFEPEGGYILINLCGK